MKYEQISIIGSGNVGWHLAIQLEKAGHTVNEVFSRDIAHAEKLTDALYTTAATDSLDFTESDSEVFLLAVPDDKLDWVASEILVPEGSIVAHTAGSKPLSVLSGYEFSAAVFYPLQTLTKGKLVDFSDVPLCIEAEDDDVLKRLLALAKTLSSRVEVVTTEQRAVLHVAAVFACNFTNHLLHLASNIVEAEDLDFEILHPLVAETINKAMEMGPAASQTGPAIRGDVRTMDRHLHYLDDNPELKRLYQLLSISIIANR